jgi:hypothetical protein
VTLFDRLQRNARRWLDDIDQVRDRAALFVARYGGSAELDAYLDALEAERARHLLLMDGLEALRRQNHPFLLLDVRPRMLKAGLPPARLREGRVAR